MSLSEDGNTMSFLSSLQVDEDDRDEFPLHPDALFYLMDFNNTKEELALILFSFYNDIVFDNGLPPSLNLIWSSRLSSTAGYFSGKREVIVLSSKIIKTSTILVSTLIHEMCHAAVRYLDNKIGLPPHGIVWKKWAVKARNCLPEIPRITVTHSFIYDLQMDEMTIETFDRGQALLT